MECIKNLFKKEPEKKQESKYQFSKRSMKKLDQCDTDLKKLFLEVIREIDCTVIEGHRAKDKQDQYFEEGASKLAWPNSKHNSYPSLACDVVPCPLDWSDTDSFKELAKVVKKCAKKLKIPIRWGGDWILFRDYPHYELKRHLRRVNEKANN